MGNKRQPVSTAKPAETCVLIGLATRHQRREQLEEYLDELAFLAETAKAETKRVFIQGLDKPDVRTCSSKIQSLNLHKFSVKMEVKMSLQEIYYIAEMVVGVAVIISIIFTMVAHCSGA